MKGRLLINKMQWQILNPLSVLNCFLYHDRSFINIVINKPTLFNFVRQLIKKMYPTGTMWFYRFACAIGPQAHISLMTRLMHISMKACFRLILWFWWRWSSILKVPKIASFAMPLKYLKKEDRDEVDFLHVGANLGKLNDDLVITG